MRFTPDRPSGGPERDRGKPGTVLSRLIARIFGKKQPSPREKTLGNEYLALRGNTRSQLRSLRKSIPVDARRPDQEKKTWIGRQLSRAQGLFDVSQESYYNAQDLSNNCGPTAASIAAAKLLGGDAQALENDFTHDRPGAMSWSSPFRWLQSKLGLSVRQRDSMSPQEIHQAISSGAVVMASVTPKSGLTSGGHITSLVGSAQSPDGEYQFVNADPNYRNIARGKGIIDADVLEHGGAKQYWIVSKTV